jgi:hypothetical protein
VDIQDHNGHPKVMCNSSSMSLFTFKINPLVDQDRKLPGSGPPSKRVTSNALASVMLPFCRAVCAAAQSPPRLADVIDIIFDKALFTFTPVGDMQLGEDVGGIVADGWTEHEHSSNIGVAARDQIAPQARTASSSKTGPVGAVAVDAAKKSIIRCNR